MASISEKLGQATVGIAGLGGLGSADAISLVRVGLGRLIIVDFDTVEKSNLSRQQYFSDQAGKSKVEAMTENLRRINADVKIEGHQVKLNKDNIAMIFAEADVIAECLDNAEEKQMIVETVLTKMDKPIIVSAFT